MLHFMCVDFFMVMKTGPPGSTGWTVNWAPGRSESLPEPASQRTAQEPGKLDWTGGKPVEPFIMWFFIFFFLFWFFLSFSIVMGKILDNVDYEPKFDRESDHKISFDDIILMNIMKIDYIYIIGIRILSFLSFFFIIFNLFIC